MIQDRKFEWEKHFVQDLGQINRVFIKPPHMRDMQGSDKSVYFMNSIIVGAFKLVFTLHTLATYNLNVTFLHIVLCLLTWHYYSKASYS